MAVFQSSDFMQLDALLTEEERQLRDRVRTFVNERFLPVVVQHYRAGTLPL